MSYWSFNDQEEVIILTTQKPTPRWLRIIMILLAAILALGVLAALIIAARYYVVQQRLKKDLTVVIQSEEEIRALGGINAMDDIIDKEAPGSWRFRYLSSIRARAGRSVPKIKVTKVEYDGFNARVTLSVDGVLQYRRYRLYEGHNWRRYPFDATGWGHKKTIEDVSGFNIIYWNEDEEFAQDLADDLPNLATQMQQLGLNRTTTKLMIIPQEFGDLVHQAKQTEGLKLNSPHVDWIDAPLADLALQQMIRAELGRRIITDARKQSPIDSDLPGGMRVQDAIDEVLAWHWAVGDVPDIKISDWTATLKGKWVSPIMGLPPDLITRLPPESSDAAARLMMTWVLREKGPDALLALSAALPAATNWDDVYQPTAGLSAFQVEERTRQWLHQPQSAQLTAKAAENEAVPAVVTLLTIHPDAKDSILARTPTGQIMLLQAESGAKFTLADGSEVDLACVAPGTSVRVQGKWQEKGLRLKYSSMRLEQAVLPLAIRPYPFAPNADILYWRYRQDENGRLTTMQLEESFTNDLIKVLARPASGSFPAILSRPEDAPLLVWRQDVHCQRMWIMAYEPRRGVVGSWLAPANATRIKAMAFIPNSTPTVLLISPHGNRVDYFRTAAQHVLKPLSYDEWHTLISSAPNRYQPRIDHQTQTVQLFDLAEQTQAPIYQTGPDEELLAIVPAFGWPEDLLFFTVREKNTSADAAQVMKVSTMEPGRAAPIFAPPKLGEIVSMARCPDDSILYGMSNPTNHSKKGILHLRSPEGKDKALGLMSDKSIMPVLCNNTPDDY